MIILDNSVLSAFTRLKLLPSLRKLLRTAMISKEIFSEYSREWQKRIPKWINIRVLSKEIELGNIPSSLSDSDISIIKLSLEINAPLASDDKSVRNYAKSLGIGITGSIGLLKMLYQKKIIDSKENYVKYIELLRQDLYFSDELMKWALQGT
jgi:predicted nucleic acid-binding protein